MESGRKNQTWDLKRGVAPQSRRDMSSVNESDTDVSYDLSDGSISLPAVCNRDAEGGERKRRSARTVSQAGITTGTLCPGHIHVPRAHAITSFVWP